MKSQKQNYFYFIILVLFFSISYSQTETINLNGHGQGLRLTNTADKAGTYITFIDHDSKSANIGSFDDNYTDNNFRNSLQFFARNGKDVRFSTSSDGTAGTNKFAITNNGNIGIGTINPTEKLQINEGNLDIFGYNTSRYIRFTEANLQGAFINYDGTKNILNIGVNNINSADLTNDYNSISIVRGNGNVGIGTTSPDMKLTVKGNIHAEEVKIDLNVPAPDYVFKEDYDLRSIEELENFIKENSHLPEIPSAKEFERNGVMQAEMDMNLLKKIEELTLYTIQQQKEIESLKKENQEVKLLNTKLIELQSRLEKLETEK